MDAVEVGSHFSLVDVGSSQLESSQPPHHGVCSVQLLAGRYLVLAGTFWAAGDIHSGGSCETRPEGEL